MEKRIAFINAVPYGSTGRIVQQLAEYGMQRDYKVQIHMSWTKNKSNIWTKNVYRGTFLGKVMHIVAGRLCGLSELMSIFDTYMLIWRLRKFQPDVINLHILHSWSFNLPILFRFINKNKIPVVWTMHDCWAITGHCPHFTVAGCDKWISGCENCPQHRGYPLSLLDVSKYKWNLKKRLFTSVENMVLITPSAWLKGIISHSFLKDYKTKVIYNGIDLTNFKPTSSTFRQDNAIANDKFMILGVSFDWSYKKGLDVFVELSERLDDRFKLVIVGVDEKIQAKLPANILSIRRTQSVEELVRIYSAADLFLNPTREEVFGLVNVEALACGTPVLAFDTGGTPECFDESCGAITKKKTAESIYGDIMRIYEEYPFTPEACTTFARKFEKEKKHKDYYKIFDACVGK